jgi:hypothetical protein
MRRSLIVLIACSAPALAQTRDETIPPRTPLTTGPTYRVLTLAEPRPDSLLTRPRYFDRPVDTGLVRPEVPDEALIDVEAWLREPIPEEELIRLRAGLKRPARGTVLREPITLPDEESLRRHEELLRPTIDGMQGRWRVERMYLDGAELRLDQFAGVKYLVQNRVIFQSEMSEEGGIPENVAAALTPTNGNGTNGTPREPGMEPKPEATPAPTPVYTRPASPSLPAPAVLRNDPRQEEGMRLAMLFQSEGRAAIYAWDRYGESVDPHLSTNRPSQRVAMPIRGRLRLGDDRLTIGLRGVGLRAFLPSKFHVPFAEVEPRLGEGRTPLEPERIVVVVLVRDEVVAQPLVEERKRNIIPVMSPVRLR